MSLPLLRISIVKIIFQTLVTSISQVRFDNGKTPSVVRQFFIDQLRYNDNTSNPVSFDRCPFPYNNSQPLSTPTASISAPSYLQLHMRMCQLHLRKEANFCLRRRKTSTQPKTWNSSNKPERKLTVTAVWTD